jgi:hypothetical protein
MDSESDCGSDFFSLLGIRDILVRIRIRGSVPLANGSGADSRSDFNDIKDAKKKISYHLPAGTLSSVFNQLL